MGDKSALPEQKDDLVKHHWDQQAREYGASYEASWCDRFAVELEFDVINGRMFPSDDVLDVGCANGHATFRYYDKGVKSITGVDICESMIEIANEEKRKKGISEKIDFMVGDVRALDFADETFDVVFTTRTLINLCCWEDQSKGILECLRVCKNNGTVIFSEAFREPLALLNSMRKINGLSPLVEPVFNNYLEKENIEKLLTEKGEKFCVEEFSSVYYLGSRFLRDVVSGDNLDAYDNHLNRIFFELETKYSGGAFGVQQAYIIRKNEFLAGCR